MILKFLPNKKGGSTASVDYLLNKKRVQNGTAKILAGDEQNTRDIINSITKKQKVTFGVLSFEEENIPEQQKKELMQEFEKTFFAGMEQEQYNILWVEHTDKGRLELNFVIPKVELSTGKTFNPYYHKTDFHLADLFERTANLKYNFTDPKDPAKESSIQGNKKALGLFKGYRNLDKKLKDLVSQGVLQSRDDIIEILKDNNIEVTKIENNQIEVKLENSKKPRKLKGGIYTDEFRSIGNIGEIGKKQAQRERAFTSRDHEKEYRQVRERLDKAVSKRAAFNAETYREPKRRAKATNGNKQENRREIYEAKRESHQASGASEKSGKIQEREREPQYLAKNQGSINDRIGETILTRTRERETILTRTRKRTREPRTSIYEKFREPRTSIYQQTRAVMQDRADRRARSNERSKSYANVARTAHDTAKAVYEARGTRETAQGELEREIEQHGNDLEGKNSSEFNLLEQIVRRIGRKAQQILNSRQRTVQRSPSPMMP